jgi:hypothetical protein
METGWNITNRRRRTETQTAIWNYVRANPGCTPREIGEALEYSRNNCNYYLGQWEQLGMVAVAQVQRGRWIHRTITALMDCDFASTPALEEVRKPACVSKTFERVKPLHYFAERDYYADCAGLGQVWA